MSSNLRNVNEDKTEDDVDNGSMLMGPKGVLNEEITNKTQVEPKENMSNNDCDAETPQAAIAGEMKVLSTVKKLHRTDILESNQAKQEDMSDQLTQEKKHMEENGTQQTESGTSVKPDKTSKIGTAAKRNAAFTAEIRNKNDSLQPDEVQKEDKRDHEHSYQMKNEDKGKSPQPGEMQNSVKAGTTTTSDNPDKMPKPGTAAKGIKVFTAENKKTDILECNQVKTEEKKGHSQPRAVKKENKSDNHHSKQVKDEDQGKAHQPEKTKHSVKIKSTTSDNTDEMPKPGTVLKGIVTFTLDDENKTKEENKNKERRGHLQPEDVQKKNKKDHTHSKQVKNEDQGKSHQPEKMKNSVKADSGISDFPDEKPKPDTTAKVIEAFTPENKNKADSLESNQVKNEGKRGYSQLNKVLKEDKRDNEHSNQVKNEDKGKSPQTGEMQDSVKADITTRDNPDEMPKPGTAAKVIATFTDMDKKKINHLQTTKKKEDTTSYTKYKQTANDDSNDNQQSKKTEKQDKRYLVQPTPVDTEHHIKTPKTFSLRGNVSMKTAGFENKETDMCRSVSKEIGKSTAGKFK